MTFKKADNRLINYRKMPIADRYFREKQFLFKKNKTIVNGQHGTG